MNRKANPFQSVVWKLSGSFAWWAIFTGCSARHKELIVPHEFVAIVSWYVVSFRYVSLFLQKKHLQKTDVWNVKSSGLVLFCSFYICVDHPTVPARYGMMKPLVYYVLYQLLGWTYVPLGFLCCSQLAAHEVMSIPGSVLFTFAYPVVSCQTALDWYKTRRIKKQLFRIYTDCCIWMFLTTPLRSQTTLKKVHKHTDTHAHTHTHTHTHAHTPKK